MVIELFPLYRQFLFSAKCIIVWGLKSPCSFLCLLTYPVEAWVSMGDFLPLLLSKGQWSCVAVASRGLSEACEGFACLLFCVRAMVSFYWANCCVTKQEIIYLLWQQCNAEIALNYLHGWSKLGKGPFLLWQMLPEWQLYKKPQISALCLWLLHSAKLDVYQKKLIGSQRQAVVIHTRKDVTVIWQRGRNWWEKDMGDMLFH